MTDSLAEFFRMGGYAFYVWGSYAVVATVLVLNFVAPVLRHRRIRRALALDFDSTEARPDEP